MKLWWIERKFWFVCNLTEVLIRITKVAIKHNWLKVARFTVDKSKRLNALEYKLYYSWRKKVGLDNTT